jgi:hypothetical protein
LKADLLASLPEPRHELDKMPALATNQKSSEVPSSSQPWRSVWPQNKDAEIKEHLITYGARKGTRMIVDGSAGHATLRIIYDTGKTE